MLLLPPLLPRFVYNMGCSGSKPTVEQMISAQLELQIEQDRLLEENKIKLLLLGAILWEIRIVVRIVITHARIFI